MTDTVTVNLKKPIRGHEGLISEVILREPTYREIMPLGMPYRVHRNGDDQMVVYDNDALQQYVERCTVKPEATLLQQCGLEDTLDLRDAILRFFLPSPDEGGGSTTSPKNSGSMPASSPTPSAA